MIQEFLYQGEQIAIIIKKDNVQKGANFFTEEKLSQQIGILKYDKGHTIAPHLHNNKKREIFQTQETLIIRKGKLRLDLYSKDKKYIESAILNEEDIAMLISGGHGLCCLEDSEIIEVKQGPYLGREDKIIIEKANILEVKIND